MRDSKSGDGKDVYKWLKPQIGPKSLIVKLEDGTHTAHPESINREVTETWTNIYRRHAGARPSVELYMARFRQHIPRSDPVDDESLCGEDLAAAAKRMKSDTSQACHGLEDQDVGGMTTKAQDQQEFPMILISRRHATRHGDGMGESGFQGRSLSF